MKLKGFYQDRAPQECVLDDAVFYVKPLDSAKLATVTGMQQSFSSSFFSAAEKVAFARDNVTGWDNLFYDNDEPVEFTKQNAIQLLVKDEYDGLAFALFDFAYAKALELSKKTKKDAETAGKS